MSAIDDRIVRMEFDNKQFEQGVSTTLTSLQKLKEALSFRGGNKGMDDVQKAANSLNFGAINDQIYQVQQNFSFFGEFVHNIFSRISNKLIDLGVTMGKALTTEPIRDGFSEYELQMNSVQTIMAGSGESIERVNEKLEELNTYADKTIYSFSDMTENIGSFTNAGIDLDTATRAIQGISNAAALAGAGTAQASSAMYNFSQSISGGYLNLMDWRSISRYAKVGTKDFADELIRTGLAMGTLVKKGDQYVSTTTDLNGKVSDAFDATTHFDDSLAHQWATREVILEALQHYGTDIRDLTDAEREEYEATLMSIYGDEAQVKAIEQLGIKAADSAKDVKTFSQLIDTVKEGLGSGWTRSLQYIFGDLEEAKVLWTGVNEEIEGIIGPITTAREEMLKFWHDNGGREKGIKAIRNAWKGVKSIMGAVADGFRNVFPPMTGETLINITNGVYRLSKRFKELASSKRVISNLHFIFGGLAGALKLLARAAQNVYEHLQPLLDVFGTFGATVFDGFADIGLFVKKLSEAEHPLSAFSDLSVDLNRGLKTIVTGFDRLISSILKFAKIDIRGNPLTKLYDTISGLVSGGFKSFDPKIFSGIGTAISNAFSGIGNAVRGKGTKESDVGGVTTVGDRITSAFGSLTSKLGDVLSKTLPSARDGIGGFVEFLSGIGTKISEIVTTIAEKLPEMFEYLGSSEFKDFATTLRTLAGSGLLVSLTNFVNTYTNLAKQKIEKKGIISTITETLGGIVKGVASRAEGVLDSLGTAIEKFQTGIQSGQLVMIAVSLKLIASSIKELSEIDAKKAADGVGTLTIAMMMLLGGLKVIQTILSDTGGISEIATSLIKMAIALGILSHAIETLSKLPIENLGRGLATVAAMLLEYAVVVRLLDGSKVSISAMLAVLSVSVAIKILEKTVATFAKMKWSQIAVGLSTVGSLLFEFAAFLTYLDGTSMKLGAIIAIAVTTAALKTLKGVVKSLAKMEWSQIAVGLSAVASLLFEFAAFLTYLEGVTVSLSAIVTLATVTAAIKTLSEAVKEFAGMAWSQVATGLSAVGSLLFELLAFITLLDGRSVSLSAIVTLITITAAVKLLEETVKTFSGLGWDKLSTGLSGIAVVLGSMVAALMVLGYGSPMMIVGAGALVVVAGALGMMVPVLQSLAKIKVGDLAKAIGAVVLALVGMSVGLAVLGVVSPLALAASLAFMALGVAAGYLGTGLVTLAKGGTAFAAALTASATSVMASIKIYADGIQKLFGAIVIGIAMGIKNAIIGFLNSMGDILKALGSAIHSVGDFIVGNLPYMLGVAATFISSILALAITYIPQVAYLAAQFVLTIVKTFVALLPVLGGTIILGIVTLVNTVANGIRDNAPAIISAVSNLLSSIIELVLVAIEDILRLIPGVGDFLADKVEEGRKAVQEALAPDSLESSTTDAMGGAIRGIEKGGGEMEAAASEAAAATKEGISGQLTGGEEISSGFMDELVAGLNSADADLAAIGTANVDSYISSFQDTSAAGAAGESFNAELLSSLNASDLYGAAGTENVTSFFNSFDMNEAAKKGNELSSSAASGASKGASKFTSAAKTDAQGFIRGLSGATATAAGKKLAGTGSSGAESTKSGYQSVGSSVASGFAWGVASPAAMSIARTAGIKLGNKAIEGIKVGVASHSPSREAMKVGRFTTQGFAIGIGSLSDLAYDEAVGVGQKSIDGLRDSISNMSKYLDAGMDFDPTIRPVLDLSDVQNGITQIDGMFNRADGSLTVGFGNNDYANSVLSSVLGTGKFNASGLSNALNATNKTVNVSVNLQYDASADANELARGIARAVQPYVVRGE